MVEEEQYEVHESDLSRPDDLLIEDDGSAPNPNDAKSSETDGGGERDEEAVAHKILGLQHQEDNEDVYMDGDNGEVEIGTEMSGSIEKSSREKSVYVGNVDYSVTVEELRDHFAACGAINRVTICVNKQTGSPLGYGYIEFTKPEGAGNALMLDETELKERIIKVALKRKNIPGMGRYSGRGARGGFMANQGNMNEAFQNMMVNPMMMSMMMSMMGGGGNMMGRGRGRGGRGGRGGGPGDLKRTMKR
eukprot:GHVH01009560.1.p1 GENE.GHVH01009560.1~~GHVH01009560.1.p1  ORF type:complete len:269 (+),score=40.40 GHVH01009560.1:68-808(+)